MHKGHWIWRLNVVRPLATFISWKFMNRGIQRYTADTCSVCLRLDVQVHKRCLSYYLLCFVSLNCTSTNYRIYPFYSRVTKFEIWKNCITFWHLRHFFRFKKFLIMKNSVILSSYWSFCGVNLLAKKAKIRKSRISGPTI